MEDEKIVDDLILDKLIQCFSVFGLEGTEDVINRNLGGKLQERFLSLYHDILWRKR